MTIPTPTIQRGTVVAAGANATVAITAVDASKSILMMTCSNDNNGQDQRVFSTVRFTTPGATSTELTLSRDASGSGNITWNWEIYTFASGVFVQHFTANAPGVVTTNVPIPIDVNLAKSFPIIHLEWNNNASPWTEHLRCDLNAVDSFALICGTTLNTGKRYTVQIVEMDDPAVTVAKYSHTWTTENVATPAITSIDTTKAFVVSAGFSSASATAQQGATYYTASITGATTVTLRKNTGTQGAGVSVFYVVEIDQADMLVQHEDDIAASSGVASSTFGTAIDISKTMVITGNYFFSFAANGSSNAQQNAFRSSISTTTNSLTSGGTSSTAKLSSQVISFGPAVPPSEGDGGIYDRIVDTIYSDKITPSVYG